MRTNNSSDPSCRKSPSTSLFKPDKDNGETKLGTRGLTDIYSVRIPTTTFDLPRPSSQTRVRSLDTQYPQLGPSSETGPRNPLVIPEQKTSIFTPVTPREVLILYRTTP